MSKPILTKFLGREDPELIRAWATFADPVQEHNGEAWQYMGSMTDETGTWLHTFRHRCLPPSGERANIGVPARSGWAAADAIPFNEDVPF